jgi:hypothetical protein
LAAVAFLAMGLVLAGPGLAGCSRQPEAPGASVKSCTEFGVAAIKQHVIVTSLPPACQGLTSAQVSFAVGSALHSAAIGAVGKVQQRDRIGKASKYLEHLVVNAPAQATEPVAHAPRTPNVGRTALGLVALCCWLITVGLGLWMMARRVFRKRGWRTGVRRIRRLPARNLGHLGLGGLSLLAWISYLATGLLALAWTACVLLAVVTGLGMSLVFNSSRDRRGSVFTVGAHIILASQTILFAVLAAIGT